MHTESNAVKNDIKYSFQYVRRKSFRRGVKFLQV